MQIIDWNFIDKNTYASTCKIMENRIEKFKQKYPKIKKNTYPDEMLSLLENCIFVFGHAWCMDVKSERRKMAKLWFKLLNQLKD